MQTTLPLETSMAKCKSSCSCLMFIIVVGINSMLMGMLFFIMQATTGTTRASSVRGDG